jgi:hypothetical protein
MAHQQAPHCVMAQIGVAAAAATAAADADATATADAAAAAVAVAVAAAAARSCAAVPAARRRGYKVWNSSWKLRALRRAKGSSSRGVQKGDA